MAAKKRKMKSSGKKKAVKRKSVTAAAQTKVLALKKKAKVHLDAAQKKFSIAQKQVNTYMHKNPKKAALIAAGVGAAIGAAIAVAARRSRKR